MESGQKREFLLKTAYITVWAAICYAALRYGVMLFIPFLLGFSVSYILRPSVGFILRHSGMKRKYASLVTALGFYATLAACLWFAGIFLAAAIESMAAAFPSFLESAVIPRLETLREKLSSGRMNRLSELIPGDIAGIADTGLNALSEKTMAWASGIAAALPKWILIIIFTVLSTVFICADYDGVSGFVMMQIPERFHKNVLDARDFLFGALRQIIKAYLIIMLITFAGLAIGLWLLKIEFFIMVAACIAILDTLPVIGSGVALVPWGICLLISGDYFTGAGLIILWVVISVAREIIEPKIIGGKIGLSALATLTSMYLGLRLAGFWGLIAAPVLCLLIKYLRCSGILSLYKT